MDARRALSIKVGSVRRLGADWRSYEKELSSYSAMLRAAEAQRDASAVKKHREFVEECAATMRDIRARLADAVQQLQTFMATNTELVGSDDWRKAQQTLKDNQATLADSGAPPSEAEAAAAAAASSEPSPPPPPPSSASARFSVAVYGGSQARAGDAAYECALQLGQALAENDFHIVSGGYGGVMEAVSAGGRRVAGASVEGIISPQAFPMQGGLGNAFLTSRTLTNDLPQRVVTFLSRCQAFVVLPGGLGTLTELALTWNVSAVTDLQEPPHRRPLCLLALRSPWQAVIDGLRAALPISDAFLSHVTFVDDTADIIARLRDERDRFRAAVQPQQQQRPSQSQPQPQSAAEQGGSEGKEERR